MSDLYLMKKVIILKKRQVSMETFAPPYFNHFNLNLNKKKTCWNENHEKETNYIYTSAADLHSFFKSKIFFNSTVFLTFSWIELQMLLRCCLIHLSITILRDFLYLLYLYLFVELSLYMSYLWALFFILIFIFIMINRMNTDILVLLLIFQNLSCYFWMITSMKKVNNFQIAKVQSQGDA